MDLEFSGNGMYENFEPLVNLIFLTKFLEWDDPLSFLTNLCSFG